MPKTETKSSLEVHEPVGLATVPILEAANPREEPIGLPSQLETSGSTSKPVIRE